MGYKRSNTICRVHLIRLRLSEEVEAQCELLRRESGRCWSDMVDAHVSHRGAGEWLSSPEMEKLHKGRDRYGRYGLHSQSVQALAQKLDANVDTARELRKQERAANPTHEPKSRFPYKAKTYQTVVWKQLGIRVVAGRIYLSCGLGRNPLVLPLPVRYTHTTIQKAELLWRADHYQLAITVDTGLVPLVPVPHKSVDADHSACKIAGLDPGEINIGAVVTQDGRGICISGRALRSVKQLRNKRLSNLTSKLDSCPKPQPGKPNSRKRKKLQRHKNSASALLHRQQRDILHKSSHKVETFCLEEGVTVLAVGDVRDIADGVDKGSKQDQKMSQWAHGQFLQYLRYKLARHGIEVVLIDEAYSTRTCSCCGHVRKSSPRGRVYRCTNPGCGATLSRDGNGAANICSHHMAGRYAAVQLSQDPGEFKYLRPLVRERSRAEDTSRFMPRGVESCQPSLGARSPAL
jgi:putative transposase